MLLLPVDRKLEWHRPPVTALLLIVLNVGCFFIWQSSDDEQVTIAMDYYGSSGLIEAEYPYFERYMRSRERSHEVPSLTAAKRRPASFYYAMLDDAEFLQ